MDSHPVSLLEGTQAVRRDGVSASAHGSQTQKAVFAPTCGTGVEKCCRLQQTCGPRCLTGDLRYLSSYQAFPVYGSFSNEKSKNHPFWKKTALNPGELGGQSPPSWQWPFPYRSVREQIGRSAIAERLVRAPVIVEPEVAIQRWQQIGPAGEVAGVDEFVLQAAPQALDENVVQGTASSIHADGDAALLQRRQKIWRGELGPLIGVPDFGLAEAERRFQRGQTEAGLHRIGQFPTEHEAAEPIHHGNQVEEAAMHRNVRNIGAPDLVGPFDGDAAQ